MWKIWLAIISVMGLSACKVRAPLEGDSSFVLEAPAAEKGETVVDPSVQCEENGGQFLQGYCVCEDGKVVKDKTCSQHIKVTYPKCFAKGGIVRLNGKTPSCVCEHGDFIDVNGNKTCYQLFTERNQSCASRLAMQAVNQRACTCYHDGKLVFNLRPGQNCQQDFKASNPTCYAQGGVTKVVGGPCICRDGSHVKGEEKCPEPWFFYAGDPQFPAQTQIGQSKPGGNTVDTTLPKCRCSHVAKNGKHYCGIHRSTERTFLKYTEVEKSADCTLNHCYTHFNAQYTSSEVCASDVKLHPSLEQLASDNKATGASSCTCKEITYRGQRGCGLFESGIQRFATWTNKECSGQSNFCRDQWSGNEWVRRKCTSIQ